MVVTQAKRKPIRSAITLGTVDPDWQWAWRDLKLLLPFWEGAGLPFDYAGRKLTELSDGAPLWSNRPDGIALYFNGIDEGIKLTDGLDEITGNTEVTSYLRLEWTSEMESVSWLWCKAQWCGFKFTGWDKMSVQCTISGFNRDTATSLDLPTGRYINIFGRWRSGDYIHLDIYEDDGRTFDSQVSAATYAGSMNNGLGQELRIGRGANAAGGYFSLFAIWDRMLTDEECIKLAQEPFGMLRLADEAGVVYALAGGIITGSATLDGTGSLTAVGTVVGEAITGSALLEGTGALTALGIIKSVNPPWVGAVHAVMYKLTFADAAKANTMKNDVDSWLTGKATWGPTLNSVYGTENIAEVRFTGVDDMDAFYAFIEGKINTIPAQSGSRHKHWCGHKINEPCQIIEQATL